jgi:hypothetical protein
MPSVSCTNLHLVMTILVATILISSSLVNSPMWTDNLEAMARFSHHQDNTITQEEVAEGIRMIIEEEQYGGGTCLEISKMGLRPAPFPTLEGSGTGVPEDAVKKTHDPILAITNAEKGRATARASA